MTYLLKLKDKLSMKLLLALGITLISSMVLFHSPDLAFAENPKVIASSNPSSVSDAINKAGLTSDGKEGDGILTEGKTLIYFLMALGGLIIVGCLIMAAVKFAASSGNSSKRSESIMWIVGCFIGVWIVYKAFELAGWAINIGS